MLKPLTPKVICIQRWVSGLFWWLSSKRIRLPIKQIQETQFRSLGQEESLEKEMATYSSILAWRIPWTEKFGGLQSIGSQRVRHGLVTEHALLGGNGPQINSGRWGLHGVISLPVKRGRSELAFSLSDVSVQKEGIHL